MPRSQSGLEEFQMLSQDGALMPRLLGKQETGPLPHFSALDQPAVGTINSAISNTLLWGVLWERTDWTLVSNLEPWTLFFFKIYFLLERERESARERESERERISSRLSTDHEAWCEAPPHDPEIKTWIRIKSWTLTLTEPPRHPWIPGLLMKRDQSLQGG